MLFSTTNTGNYDFALESKPREYFTRLVAQIELLPKLLFPAHALRIQLWFKVRLSVGNNSDENHSGRISPLWE